MAAIIALDDVSVTFHEAGHTIEAVKHASLEVEQGEICLLYTSDAADDR